jgi:hypothetical protein
MPKKLNLEISKNQEIDTRKAKALALASGANKGYPADDTTDSEASTEEEPTIVYSNKQPKEKPNKLEKPKVEKVDKRRTSHRTEKQLESFKKALEIKKQNAILRKQIKEKEQAQIQKLIDEKKAKKEKKEAKRRELELKKYETESSSEEEIIVKKKKKPKKKVIYVSDSDNEDDKKNVIIINNGQEAIKKPFKRFGGGGSAPPPAGIWC